MKKTYAEIVKEVKIILDENEDAAMSLLEPISSSEDDESDEGSESAESSLSTQDDSSDTTENSSSVKTGLMEDTDQLQTDTLIEHLIPHALNRIGELAPSWMLAGMGTYLDNIDLTDISDKKYGKYFTPGDINLRRILSVNASDWEQPVREFINADSGVYKMQKSPIAGVRGTINNPVVAVVNNPTGIGLRIELYTTAQATASMVYIGDLSEAASDGNVEITDRLWSPLVYSIAALYYESINEPERAQLMSREAAEGLGINYQTTNEG